MIRTRVLPLIALVAAAAVSLGACGTSSITNSLATYQAGFASTADPGNYAISTGSESAMSRSRSLLAAAAVSAIRRRRRWSSSAPRTPVCRRKRTPALVKCHR